MEYMLRNSNLETGFRRAHSWSLTFQFLYGIGQINGIVCLAKVFPIFLANLSSGPIIHHATVLIELSLDIRQCFGVAFFFFLQLVDGLLQSLALRFQISHAWARAIL